MTTVIADFKDTNNQWVKSIVIGVPCVTKSYKKWLGMRDRCKVGGSHQARRSTYIDCVIGDNFKDFQYFAEWHTQQIGYSCSNYDLDKDILFPGNKTYSEDTCSLVPRDLNHFLTLCGGSRGEYPVGVNLNKSSGMFHANISCGGKQIYLGCYNTPDEAYLVYKAAKEAEARRWYERLVNKEYLVDDKVIERMRTWTLPDQNQTIH